MSVIGLLDELPDPRMSGKVRYNLSSIVFVTLCGVLSGCEGWGDIADYGRIKREWLSLYVDLSTGIPSSCTFRRVFTLLAPDCLETLLRSHASHVVAEGSATKQIAVDGKALRGSSREGVPCLQSVSAWCHENGLVLAESSVDKKSNEITALPALLESLALAECTVSIDAMGCQKSIARLIHHKGGHYVLGLKRNQKMLHDAITAHIREIGEAPQYRLHDAFDDSHGRCVRRRYFGYDIQSLPEAQEWEGAKSVVAVETISSRHNDPENRVTVQWRYYLSSHHATSTELPSYIRHHWGIENKLHWVLDMHLNEDNDQKAERQSARCFALLKRIALNIVRTADTTPKRSMRRKIKRAGWDNDYLVSLLVQ